MYILGKNSHKQKNFIFILSLYYIISMKLLEIIRQTLEYSVHYSHSIIQWDIIFIIKLGRKNKISETSSYIMS